MAYTGTLTADQIADVQASQAEWMANGLCTDPADRPAAEAAVRAAYRAAGIEEPGLVIWMDSPLGGAVAAATVQALGHGKDLLGGQLWDQLGGQLRDQLGGQLGGQLGDQLWGQLWGQLWDQLGREISTWYDAYWLAIYSHALPIAELPTPERLTTLAAATQSCGWWWPQAGAVILTDRPSAIHRDAQGRLHAEHGPALLYRDGYALHSWHGVRLPRDPDEIRTLGVEEILRETNTEVRRCMIEIIGWDEFVRTGKLARVGQPVPDPGNPGQTLALYDVPEQIYDAPVRVLICTNGSPERDGTRRRFGLTTPAEINDPIAAAAWGYGLTAEQYAAAEIRR